MNDLEACLFELWLLSDGPSDLTYGRRMELTFEAQGLRELGGPKVLWPRILGPEVVDPEMVYLRVGLVTKFAAHRVVARSINQILEDSR